MLDEGKLVHAASTTHGWRHGSIDTNELGRDLTDFIDGTENPGPKYALLSSQSGPLWCWSFLVLSVCVVCRSFELTQQRISALLAFVAEETNT